MPIAPKPLQIEVYCKDCGTYLKADWKRDPYVSPEIVIEPCQCPLNEIQKVFEKYKHMDNIMCDSLRLDDGSFKYKVMVDLWQAIKASLEPAEPEPPADTPTP